MDYQKCFQGSPKVPNFDGHGNRLVQAMGLRINWHRRLATKWPGTLEPPSTWEWPWKTLSSILWEVQQESLMKVQGKVPVHSEWIFHLPGDHIFIYAKSDAQKWVQALLLVPLPSFPSLY